MSGAHPLLSEESPVEETETNESMTIAWYLTNESKGGEEIFF